MDYVQVIQLTATTHDILFGFKFYCCSDRLNAQLLKKLHFVIAFDAATNLTNNSQWICVMLGVR